jgi:hypothetical protein
MRVWRRRSSVRVGFNIVSAAATAVSAVVPTPTKVLAEVPLDKASEMMNHHFYAFGGVYR